MVKLLLCSLISMALLSGCSPQKRKKLANRTDFVTKQSEVDTNTKKEEKAEVTPSPTSTASPAPTPVEAPSPSPIAAPTPKASPQTTLKLASPSPSTAPSPAPSTPPTKASNEVSDTVLPKSSSPTTPAKSITIPGPAASASPTAEPTIASKAQPQQTQAEQKDEAHDPNALELTYEETRHFFTLVTATYGQKVAGALLRPAVGKDFNGADLEAEFTGTVDKANYRFLHKKQVVVEFKDFKINLSKPIEMKANGYTLGGLCVGAKCEVLFLVLYKVTSEKDISEVYPLISKWDGQKYQVAYFMDAQKYKEKELQDKNLKPEDRVQLEQKVPPQLRVMQLLEQNRAKYKEQILKAVHARMTKDQSIYSARLFVNVKPNTFIEEFERKKEGIHFKLDIDFTYGENRAPVEFKGLIKKEGVRITDKSSMTLDIYPLIQDQFYLMVFENAKFNSPVQNPVKAVQVKLCQLLEEEGQVYSECEFLPSSRALGIMALEGKVGGPVYTKGVQVKKNGKDEEVPEIVKEYKPDFTEPQDPGF